MASPGRAAGAEPAEAGDVAKRLYLALRSKDAAAAARCVAEATNDDLLVRSPWEQWQENPPSGQEAAYATRGLTAVHVLVRDCSDVVLVQVVIARAPQALNERAGVCTDGKALQALPMHCAALKNSSVDVMRLLLEIGGAEQLQVKNQDGRLPMHCAAQKNSSVDVVRLLLGRGSPRLATSHHVRSMVDRNRDDIAELLITAGVEMPKASIRGLPRRLRETVARVSVSSVLSSYFDDNTSPFDAAVRSPA